MAEATVPHYGIETSLLTVRATGEIEQRDGYTVARTPHIPDFFFGNLLVLPGPPAAGERPRLEADFARLVGTPPRIGHMTFMWPVREGDAGTVPPGFDGPEWEYGLYPVMLAERGDLRPPARPCPGLEIRPYDRAGDWDDWREMNLRDDAGHYPEDVQRRYLAGKQAELQGLIAQGRGHWWGAWLDGRQVANMGLFFEGDTGRFQAVLTDAPYRRRGICATLVHHVAKQGLLRARRLVMVADETHDAARVYEAVGFRRRERMASLLRQPRPAPPADDMME